MLSDGKSSENALSQIKNCPNSSFPHHHRHTISRDFSGTVPRVCTAEYILRNRRKSVEWQVAHPVKYRIRNRKWRYKHLEERKQKDRIYRKHHRVHLTQLAKLRKRRHPHLIRLRAKYDGIRYRCNNPSAKAYKYYGGRGVRCRITFKEYKQLLQSAGVLFAKGFTIDRIDHNGDYTVKNCQILSRSENSKKRWIENNWKHRRDG